MNRPEVHDGLEDFDASCLFTVLGMKFIQYCSHVYRVFTVHVSNTVKIRLSLPYSRISIEELQGFLQLM